MKTIDLTPSWRAAVRIYVAVLQNPKAGAEAHQRAEEDLLRLADDADKRIAAEKGVAPTQAPVSQRRLRIAQEDS